MAHMMPVALRYAGAHTHRLSGDWRLNMQNLPRDSNLRRALIAPPGHTVVAGDLAQIEARLTAWIAGTPMLETFRAGKDPYAEMASNIFNRPITKADTVERFIGKTCLAGDTLVLTNKGFIRIVDVDSSVKLWDGQEWVGHKGLMVNGLRLTLQLCGVSLTPDHLVLSGTRWISACATRGDENTLSRALDTAVESLPLRSRAIFGFQLEKKTIATEGRSMFCSDESLILKSVYDIADVGPRNRFTILTERGPLIVHNCILGLGYGMGKDKFYVTVLRTARAQNIDVTKLKQVWTPELAGKSVQAYRRVNRSVVGLWYKLDTVLATAWSGFGEPVQLGPLTIGHGYVRGPNGLEMRYVVPEGSQGKSYLYAKVPHTMWGGSMLENCCQYLARVIIVNAAVRMSNLGYNMALQAHDELVYVVRSDDVDNVKALLYEELVRPPSWALDLPLGASISSGQSYGDC